MKEETMKEIKKAVKAVGKSVLAFLYAIVGDAETAADTVKELDINI